MFPENYLADLNRFARIVWGNPHALLRRLHPQGVEFIDLSEFDLPFRYLTSGILKSDKILVRDEYRAIFPALQTDLYQNGAYVTGQPGIGKTYFLLYALIHLLGEKQAVAMQPLDGSPVYLLFQDTVTLHAIVDPVPLHQCSFVWALCDSNASITIPAGVFRTATDKVRVIQATSPKAFRWKEWSKQIGAECYIMDIWTEEEITNLATLLGRDVGHMVTLTKKWGPVPRTLLRNIDEEDWFVERLYREDSKHAVAKCPTMIGGARRLDLQDGPSPFYFIRPQKHDNGVVIRRLPYVSVPTTTLLDLLAEGLKVQDNFTKIQFYNTLSQHAETRQAAGMIYERWFHSFFSAEKEIRCAWLSQGLDDNTAQLPTTLRGTKALPPSILDALTTSMPPYYWLPPNANFPGIDSALVLENEIFAFQLTIRAHHRSLSDGLQKLRKRLPGNLKELPWRVVFVGPDEDRIKQTAQRWDGQLFFPTRGTRRVIPVGWSTTDPAQEGVIYKTYRDEANPVLDDSDDEMMEERE